MNIRGLELKKSPCFPCSKSVLVRALVYACTRNQDEQRPSQFPVAAPAFLAAIHLCREPLPVAYLQAGQYQPRQNSVIQMYML